MSDTAVALARQEEHLVFKSVAVQRIRIVKNDGFSFPPIFEVEFCTVFGGDSAHGFLFTGLFRSKGIVLICVGSPILVERTVRRTLMVMARIYPLHLLLLYCYPRVSVALRRPAG